MTDEPQGAQPARYDPTTIRLHWLTAFLVVLLWCLGETIDFFPRGAPRVGARSLHIVLGFALAALYAARVWWRIARGARLPNAAAGALGACAKIAHVLLYLLLGAVLAFGIANTWVRGDNVFGLFSIPSFAPDDRALHRFIGHWHGTLADALLILAALHAAAGLLHHYVWKDGVLRRMLAPR